MIMRRLFCVIALVLIHSLAFAESQPQPRTSMEKVDVPLELIRVGDGDTIVIDWPTEGEGERIRILGIDTPETQNPAHNLPYDQSFGPVATGFAKGAFAAAQSVQLLRAASTDGYGRTLGYVFIDGINYSTLILKAGLAVETVTHYGDNGFPEDSAEILSAVDGLPPGPFEAPYLFRLRMREVSEARADS
jgi:endonuclease YncB( thermonuclease family)